MAYIAHRCTCGHLMDHHSAPGTCHAAAGRPCPGACTRTPGTTTPELVPTWQAGGRPVTRIAAPGSTLPGRGRLCDCPACHSLYDRLTADD